MIKTILVTGGAGFIGSNFIRYILKRRPDTKIINLDRLTYCGNPENVKELESNPNYAFIHGDICDQSVVETAMKNADAVIHFAAESHVDNSIKDPFVFTRTNVLGTHTLLEAARKYNVKKFLHISTDEIYGSVIKGKSKETDPPNPSSPYSASKAAAEQIALGFFSTFKLPVLMVRCSNVFGPRQYPEKLIPLFITNLLENKKVPLMGDGLHRRNWIYVEDAVRAIDFVFKKGKIGEIYNIPGTKELSNIETTRKIIKLLGKDASSIESIPNRLAHDRRYCLDGTKLKNLGWKPKWNFDEALGETVHWYEENKAWWKKLKNSRTPTAPKNSSRGQSSEVS